MNLLKKFLLFTGLIAVFQLECRLSDTDLTDLTEFSNSFLDSLDDTEKEKIAAEANMITDYISGLSKEEQEAFQEALESELKTLMDSGELFDMTKDELLGKPAEPVEPIKPIEPKHVPTGEEKKESELKFAQNIPQLKKELKEISKRISSISLKMDSPTRKKDSDIDNAWTSIKPKLMETQAYILVISNNDKLMDALLSADYKMLKNQFDEFYKDIVKEDDKLEIPEDFKTKADFKPIIKFLEKNIEKDLLLGNTKRFMEKFAPEVVKEEEKKHPQPVTPSYNPSTPSLPSSYPSYPSYPSGPTYRERDNNYNPGGNYGGINRPTPRPTPSPTPGPKPTPPTPPKPTPPKPTPKPSPTPGPKTPEKKDDNKGKGKTDDKKDEKKPQAVSATKKEAEDLEKHLKKLAEKMEKNSALKHLEDLEKAISTNNIGAALVNDATLAITEISALIDEPGKTASEINKKLSPLPNQFAAPERKKLKEILEDKKHKFITLHEKLNKLLDKNTRSKIGQQAAPIDAGLKQLYKQLEKLAQDQKKIIELVKGDGKSKVKSTINVRGR